MGLEPTNDILCHLARGREFLSLCATLKSRSQRQSIILWTTLVNHSIVASPRYECVLLIYARTRCSRPIAGHLWVCYPVCASYTIEQFALPLIHRMETHFDLVGFKPTLASIAEDHEDHTNTKGVDSHAKLKWLGLRIYLFMRLGLTVIPH